MAAFKLNRIEYIRLSAIRENGMSAIGKLTESQLNRFLLYGLLLSHQQIGSSACSYSISAAGAAYLESTPMPPIKMPKQIAEAVWAKLGTEEYACMGSLSLSTQAFDNMIEEGAFAHDPNSQWSGDFVLTTEGRKAFEETEVGKIYLARRADRERREKVEAKFSLMKVSKKGSQVDILMAKAAYMERAGFPEFANDLRLKAKELQTIIDIREKYLAPLGVLPDAKINLDSELKLRSIQIGPATIKYDVGDQYNKKPPHSLWYVDYWISDSFNSQYSTWDQHGFDGSEQADTAKLNSVLVALRVARLLNIDRVDLPDTIPFSVSQNGSGEQEARQ